jgi:uncharacterized protein (DUF2252 family)
MMSKNAVEFPGPHDRKRLLDQSRNLNMTRSPHRYVRGSTVKFYEWINDLKGNPIPDAPAIWICGDCHSGNLGPIANRDGAIEIQIRDLDQTVIGNPAHDLLRVALLLASAARGSDLPGVTTALMLEAIMEGHEAAFVSDFDEARDFDTPRPAPKDAKRRKATVCVSSRARGVFRPILASACERWSFSENPFLFVSSCRRISSSTSIGCRPRKPSMSSDFRRRRRQGA